MSIDQRPNILLITMDQLRWDALGCANNPVVKTPNIDRLAREGVRAEHFFVQSPMCQPSRATLTTGRYPRAHGVKWNWYDLPSSEVTPPSLLSAAGYHTHAVGKMHFTPLDRSYGFDDRFFVEGKMYADYDEYRAHLRDKGLDKDYFDHVGRWNNKENFGSDPFPLGDEDYIDTFIGGNAARLLSENRMQPFFFWVSFCNPHMPFDPPAPFDRMYDPSDIDVPPDFDMDQRSRIPEFRTSSGQADFGSLDESVLRQVMARYYGTISLVDREVGRILDALEGKGILDDTIVVFLADHGEMLGHRNVLWKGRMLYDHLVRTPFIVRYPRELRGGQIVSDLIQAVDLAPTLLDYAGVDGHAGMQGMSLRRLLRKDSVQWRQWAFAESLNMKMVRTPGWKLIHYGGKPYGELYYIAKDPLELDNLWDDPHWAGKRAELTSLLADILIETEDPLPLPARGSAYESIAGDHPEQEYGGRSADLYRFSMGP